MDIAKAVFNKTFLKEGDRVRVSWYPNQICKIALIEEDNQVLLEAYSFTYKGNGITVSSYRFVHVHISRIKEKIPDEQIGLA